MKLLDEAAGLLWLLFFVSAVAGVFVVSAGFSVFSDFDVFPCFEVLLSSCSEVTEDVSLSVTEPSMEVTSEFSSTLLVSSTYDSLLSVAELFPTDDNTPLSCAAQPASIAAAINTAIARLIIDFFIFPLSVVILKQPSRMRAVVIR